MKKIVFLSLCFPLLAFGMQDSQDKSALKDLESTKTQCLYYLSLLEVDTTAPQHFSGALDVLRICNAKDPNPFNAFWDAGKVDLKAQCRTEITSAKIKLTVALKTRNPDAVKHKEYLQRAYCCSEQLKKFNEEWRRSNKTCRNMPLRFMN